MGVARRLAFGRLISLSGGSAAYIALIASIYGRTHSALWVSAAIFSGTVTSVIAAAPAGWVGDRFDRRAVLIASDLAAAAVSLGMALTGRPVALVALFGLLTIAESPFEPASAAAMPNVVGERDVARANALVAFTSSAAYLGGPLLGGAVLGAGASAAAVFGANAATFVVSGALVASIGRPFGSGDTAAHAGALAGMRLIAREPVLRRVVVAGVVSLFGVGIVGVASYPLSVDLGAGAQGYGAMTALLGGGGLVGAALAARLLRFRLQRVLVSSFATGAGGLALAGASPVLVPALAGMAVSGAARGLADVAETTLIQQRANDEIRSRVFGAQEGASHVAYSVSAFAGGLLTDLAGVRGAFAAAAACAAAAAIVASRR